MPLFYLHPIKNYFLCLKCIRKKWIPITKSKVAINAIRIVIVFQTVSVTLRKAK